MKEILVFLVLLAAIIAGNSYNVLSVDLTTFFLFILVIGLLIYRDKKNVKLESIVLIRRTQKGRNFIDKVAGKSKTFWGGLGAVGVAIAIVMMILGSIFLINQAAAVAGGSQEGGVRLLLPGPVSAPTNLPGAFVVPWWIWVIGVAFVIIPHEFMHGIMCRVDKIKIKSVGWILLLVIPGAFVEPDEKQLKKAKRFTKMRVYAAGSFANIITAMIILVIMALFFAASFTTNGVYVQTFEDTPAAAANLSGAITGISGVPIRNSDDIRAALSQYNPGDTVTVNTVGGLVFLPSFRGGADFLIPKPTLVTNTPQVNSYQITLAEHPERPGDAYMGVAVGTESVSYNGDNLAAYVTISTLLLWIFVFSLGIGIVNILPIKPLDGGLLLEEIVGRFTKNPKTVSKVAKLISGIMLAVLLFNLIGPNVF